MDLSKHVMREINSLTPAKGGNAALWKQYQTEIDRLSPTVVKEALDALHKAVADRLNL